MSEVEADPDDVPVAKRDCGTLDLVLERLARPGRFET